MTNKLIERIEASWNELFYGVMKLGPGGLMLAAPDGWAVYAEHIGWINQLVKESSAAR